MRQDRLKKLINAEVFTIFILGAAGTSVPMRTSQSKIAQVLYYSNLTPGSCRKVLHSHRRARYTLGGRVFA